MPRRYVRKTDRQFLNRGGWRSALVNALGQRDPKTQQLLLDLVAQRVVLLALNGDIGAIREIGMRMDGGVPAASETSGGDEMSLVTRIERVIIDHQDGVIDLQAETVEPGLPVPADTKH